MTLDTEEFIDCLTRMKDDNQPFALATVVRTADATSAKAGAKAIVRADGSMVGWIGGGCTQGAVKKVAAQAIRDGQARLIRVRPSEAPPERYAEGLEEHKSSCPSGGTVEVFIEPMLPRPSLIVAGASPTARALCDLGRRMGFAVTLAARADDHVGLPEVDRRIEGFDLADVPLAGDSFIVVATQGKGDSEALRAALAAGTVYVAFIGSRRKAETLKRRMVEQGVSEGSVARLRSPAGLDIGAILPEEIALSVLAEIVQERRRNVRAEQAEAGEVKVIQGGTLETRIVPASGGEGAKGG